MTDNFFSLFRKKISESWCGWKEMIKTGMGTGLNEIEKKKKKKEKELKHTLLMLGSALRIMSDDAAAKKKCVLQYS